MLLSCRARRNKATIIILPQFRSYFDFVNLSFTSTDGSRENGIKSICSSEGMRILDSITFLYWTENRRNLYYRQNEPCICSGNGLAMSSLYPEMRFSWEIKSVDALFCNGLARVGDLSKEAILQAIKDGDLRFLQVSQYNLSHLLCSIAPL